MQHNKVGQQGRQNRYAVSPPLPSALSARMNKNPTDGLILDTIMKMYLEEFQSYDKNPEIRASRIYVPINCELVAEKLDMDPQLLFGRLFYHLDKVHRYTQDDGSKVHLFALKVGHDTHAVNFPLLAAAVAEHKKSFYRYIAPLVLSCIALALSGVALFN